MAGGGTRNAELTRAAVLDAAEEVFTESGFAEASVSEIARRAKVTKSLVHHHFGSKKELWSEVKQRRFLEYAQAQQAMLEQQHPTHGLLGASLSEYFSFLRRHPGFLRMLSWTRLEREFDEGSDPGFACDLLALGVQKIREGQLAGELRRDIHPFSILVAMLAMAEHWHQDRQYHMRVFPADDLPSDERYLHDVLTILLEGVRETGGASSGGAGSRSGATRSASGRTRRGRGSPRS